MRFGEAVNSLEEYIPFSYKPNMIRLDANESSLVLPEKMIKGISEAVSKVDFNRYPDPYCKELRIAYGKYYGIDPENVVVGNGSDELISIIFSSLVPADSKVLTVAPDFSMYSFYSTLYGRENKVFNKDINYNLDIDGFISEINDGGYDFVMFSNPCNPTGQAIEREDILRIVKSVKATVCVDEAYMDFWDQSLLTEVDQYDNLIVLRTVSKIGYAAYRLGFAAANAELTALIRAVKSPYNINSLSQAAGETVFADPDDLRARICAIRESRDWLYTAVSALYKRFPCAFRVPESRANFVTLLMPDPKPLFDHLTANKIYVSLNAGKYLRITCCSPEDNAKIVEVLQEYFEKQGV